METRLTRRGFFLIVGGAAAAAGAFVLQSPSRRLARHFAYLTLDPAGLDAFVSDYERHYQRSLRFRPWREDVPIRYLLSTDYFRNRGKNDGDRSQPVRYVAFYDPYITPCNNPLARFDA